MKLGNNQNRGRREEIFDVAIPDRHSPKGEGTMKDGTPLASPTLTQPWVNYDGVKADPTSTVDGDGKDVG